MGYTLDEQNLYMITNYVHGGDLYSLLFKEVSICMTFHAKVALLLCLEETTDSRRSIFDC